MIKNKKANEDASMILVMLIILIAGFFFITEGINTNQDSYRQSVVLDLEDLAVQQGLNYSSNRVLVDSTQQFEILGFSSINIEEIQDFRLSYKLERLQNNVTSNDYGVKTEFYFGDNSTTNSTNPFVKTSHSEDAESNAINFDGVNFNINNMFFEGRWVEVKILVDIESRTIEFNFDDETGTLTRYRSNLDIEVPEGFNNQNPLFKFDVPTNEGIYLSDLKFEYN